MTRQRLLEELYRELLVAEAARRKPHAHEAAIARARVLIDRIQNQWFYDILQLVNLGYRGKKTP